MKLFIITVCLFLGLNAQGQEIDKSRILGKWKVAEIIYLDQPSPRGKDGEKIIWEFLPDGKVINHYHHSTTNYQIRGTLLDMDGYESKIEKLTDKQLVLRERKAFFIRRIICEKID
ncbi:MAG: hypothetical protein ACNS62_06715 [Candidatus Cyclobacteriaceae bacterium M3_2C_046]